MQVQYLVHDQTGRKYQVLEVDKAANTIKLKGEHTEFVEPFDKDRFKANGYRLATETAPEADDDGE